MAYLTIQGYRILPERELQYYEQLSDDRLERRAGVACSIGKAMVQRPRKWGDQLARFCSASSLSSNNTSYVYVCTVDIARNL